MDKSITMEDLMTNSGAYGLPTFEEFCRRPQAWRKAADEVLQHVDIGSQTGLKNLVVRQTYEVAGYKCKSLEEVERVAKNEGWDIKRMDVEPQVVPLGGGKCNLHVKFVPMKATKEGIIEDAIKSSLEP